MNIFLKQEIANTYDDYYQTNVGRQVDQIEKNIMNKLIKNIPKGQMLELGCGTGHWTDYFSNNGFNVTGTDISEVMLNLAKSKNINARFEYADAENLPFGDESFQTVSLVTMLEFSDNPENVIGEINRVLDVNGWLILGCLNKKSVIGKNKDNDEVFKTARFFTPGEITSKLQQFEIHNIKSGVYLKQDFLIEDDNKKNQTAEAVFIGILAQKI